MRVEEGLLAGPCGGRSSSSLAKTIQPNLYWSSWLPQVCKSADWQSDDRPAALRGLAARELHREHERIHVRRTPGIEHKLLEARNGQTEPDADDCEGPQKLPERESGVPCHGALFRNRLERSTL